MKSLFKKRETPFTYNKHYLGVQKKWAEKMSGLTEGCSKKKLILLLIVFIVISAGYLLYNIYTVFSERETEKVKSSEQTSKIKIIH